MATLCTVQAATTLSSLPNAPAVSSCRGSPGLASPSGNQVLRIYVVHKESLHCVQLRVQCEPSISTNLMYVMDCSSAHIDADRNWVCGDVEQNVGVGYGMVILYSVCQFYHFPRLQELCWKLSEVRGVQWRWQSLRGKQLGRFSSDREFGRSSSQQLKQATGVSILIFFLESYMASPCVVIVVCHS